MGDERWDFRRLRRALRHKGLPSPSKAIDSRGEALDPQGPVDSTAAAGIAVDNATLDPGSRRDPASTIPPTARAQRCPADDQDTSNLFSRLPLEIRRLIYLEVWRDYLHAPGQSDGPGLRLHLYNDGLEDAVLRHARCLVHKESPAEHDNQIVPSPFEDTRGAYVIPTWYLFAWHLRKHWGKHWKCQSAVMERWVPAAGAVVAPEPSPFLAVFLTCKKM